MNSASNTEKSISTRRSFCRHLALGAATALVGGKLWSRVVIAELSAAENGPGEFILNLNDYPALDKENGSMVLSLPGAPNGLAQIVITRAASDHFYAVDSTCAHNQCTVPPSSYNPTSLQNEIVCSCHGSRYRADGSLLGGPAQRGLRAFSARLGIANGLRIAIPEFRFATRASSAQPVGGSGRIKLTFPALAFLTYKVRFRATLQDMWSPIPFARFANSALDSMELNGIGRDEEIYVAGAQPTGFFSIVST